MPKKTLIHARIFDNMAHFFNNTITVQRQSQTVSTFGEVASTWTDRANLQGVPARISALSLKQVEQAQLSGYIVTHQVLIPNYHSSMDLSDRITTTSVNYEVRQIDNDSQQRMTKLLVRRVERPSTASS